MLYILKIILKKCFNAFLILNLLKIFVNIFQILITLGGLVFSLFKQLLFGYSERLQDWINDDHTEKRHLCCEGTDKEIITNMIFYIDKI
jgi:hypothetical protein